MEIFIVTILKPIFTSFDVTCRITQKPLAVKFQNFVFNTIVTSIYAPPVWIVTS